MVAQLAERFTRFAEWRFHFNRNRVKSQRLNSYYFVTILEMSQRLKAASQENFQLGPVTKYERRQNKKRRKGKRSKAKGTGQKVMKWRRKERKGTEREGREHKERGRSGLGKRREVRKRQGKAR